MACTWNVPSALPAAKPTLPVPWPEPSTTVLVPANVLHRYVIPDCTGTPACIQLSPGCTETGNTSSLLGAAMMVAAAVPLLLPMALVTVTLAVTVSAMPALKVMVRLVAPAVMVPPVRVQA